MDDRSGVSRALRAGRRLSARLLAAALVLLVGVAVASAAGPYALDEGDVLAITVFDHPDLATTATVNREGWIRFPLVGQLRVAGRTVPEVARALTAALADGFLVDPQVTVTLQQMRTKKASVVGKVNRPGIYQFQGQMTFLELLSRAGGLSPEAGSQAVVRRRSSGSAIAGDLVIDLRSLLSEGALNRDVEIADGDTVTVAPAGVYTLAGEVRRPGEYRFEEGMTILRAVALAGGFTDRAAPERLGIVGGEGGEAGPRSRGEGGLPLETRLRPGDVVTVPAAGSYFLTGEVRRPGEYRFEAGTTLLRAVTLAGGYTERADRDRVRIIRVRDGGEGMIEPGGSAAAVDTLLEPGDIVVVNVLRAEVCYVTGEVKSAGAYPCDPETTVIKAVTLAGGFTDAAARNRIRIIRRVGGVEEVSERVGLEETVRPDDVLVVPKSFF